MPVLTYSQIDFGDAKYIAKEEEGEFEEDMSPKKKARGTFVGTVYYVSPEMLSDNISSKASDLWALGCIIYRMVYG